MTSFIINRTQNLKGFGGVFIVLFYDFLLFYLALENYRIALIVGLLLYLFIDKIIIKSTIDKISFHVYNGVSMILLDMQKRGGIINFYVFIIGLSYILTMYLLNIRDISGYICFTLIIVLKIAVYYMCYNMSKKNRLFS
ncbi:MAG: hypothetical protein LBQ34_04110 [Alphaproteobacteria bacterium]|jgi:hypothetical protein|nr:hypothetical protein [Alphaproteobacteria bacterium]